jgi:hypothetical protein
MNLSAQILVPFKTKAKASDGNIWVYIGRSGHSRYKFSRIGSYQECLTRIFRIDGANISDSGLRITEIGHKWTPRSGDNVWIQGHYARDGRAKVAQAPMQIILEQEISPGFWCFWQGPGGEHRGVAHVNIMRRRNP